MSGDANLTADQVAGRLGVKPRQVVEYANDGALAYWKLPDGKPAGVKNLRFKEADVEAFERNLRTEAVEIFLGKP